MLKLVITCVTGKDGSHAQVCKDESLGEGNLCKIHVMH